MILEQLTLFIIALLSNAMSAFAGGGSGLVQLPALILLGLPFPIALATHKIVTVALGVGAVLRLRQEKGLIDWKFAAFILGCGALGVITGAYIIVQVPPDIAKPTLAGLIISLGLYSLIKRELGQNNSPKNRDLKGQIIGGISITALGLLNGSFTAGTGLFVTMFLIQWYGLDYKRAVAYTMTLVGLFWNGLGGLTIAALGEPIHFPWIPALFIGSLTGGYLGAHMNTLTGNPWIKYAFTAVTLASGLALIV